MAGKKKSKRQAQREHETKLKEVKSFARFLWLAQILIAVQVTIFYLSSGWDGAKIFVGLFVINAVVILVTGYQYKKLTSHT